MKRAHISQDENAAAGRKSARSAPTDRHPAPAASILTPDIWAIVLSHLPFQDVLRCSVLNQTFLREVAPRVPVVSIMNASELDCRLAGRFSGVIEVKICCLTPPDVKSDSIVDTQLCHDTAFRIVPFLSRFTRLKKASLGGYAAGRYSGQFNEYDPDFCRSSGHRKVMAALVRSICGAYRSRALPNDASIRGYRCPQNHDEEDGCELCREVCQSVPVKDALGFDAITGLTSEERVAIVESRRGGPESLRSPSACLHLLKPLYYRSSASGDEVEIYYGDSAPTLNLLSLLISRGYWTSRDTSSDDILNAILRDNDYASAFKYRRVFLDEKGFQALISLGIKLPDTNQVIREGIKWFELHPP